MIVWLKYSSSKASNCEEQNLKQVLKFWNSKELDVEFYRIKRTEMTDWKSNLKI